MGEHVRTFRGLALRGSRTFVERSLEPRRGGFSARRQSKDLRTAFRHHPVSGHRSTSSSCTSPSPTSRRHRRSPDCFHGARRQPPHLLIWASGRGSSVVKRQNLPTVLRCHVPREVLYVRITTTVIGKRRRDLGASKLVVIFALSNEDILENLPNRVMDFARLIRQKIFTTTLDNSGL